VIQLHGLAKQLFPAQTFPITFQFAKAGSVTFTISVHLAPGPASTPSIDIAPTAQN
jgi:copper(I)-binding protein